MQDRLLPPNEDIKTKNRWICEQNGIKREVAESDPESVPAREFRVKEVNETVSQLVDVNRRLVFVRANSGYGVSKYFIPLLREVLKQKNMEVDVIETLNPGCADDDEYADVLVIDELEQSVGYLDGGIVTLAEIMANNPSLKVVVILDDAVHPEITEKLSAMESDGLLARVEMHPKLLNVSQATEFAMHGAPFKKTTSTSTLFEGLSFEQTSRIIVAFSKKFPLHFRLIHKLKWIQQSTDPNRTSPLSFDEKLSLIEGSTLDHEFNKIISEDPMGYRESQSGTT